jgi:SAM-dependent methyltransferase
MTLQDVRQYDERMLAGWCNTIAARPDEKLNFLMADATKLPLRNDSADEIIINNLFGSGADEEVLAGVYRQAHRALKETGKLVIHDDYLPHFVASGSLQHWLTRTQQLPVPDDIEWINASSAPKAYAEMAERYKLITNKNKVTYKKGSSTELDLINDECTIWIMGKVAINQPGPVEVVEPSTVEVTPLPRSARLRAMWRNLFPPTE